MRKNKKPQPDLPGFLREEPPVKKTASHHGYGSADEVKRRAAQGSYLQRWREELALKKIGYDLD